MSFYLTVGTLGGNKGRNCRLPLTHNSWGYYAFASLCLCTYYFSVPSSTKIQLPDSTPCKTFPNLSGRGSLRVQALPHSAQLTVARLWGWRLSLVHLFIPQKRWSRTWDVPYAQVHIVKHMSAPPLPSHTCGVLTYAPLHSGYIPALSLWPISLNGMQKELHSKVNQTKESVVSIFSFQGRETLAPGGWGFSLTGAWVDQKPSREGGQSWHKPFRPLTQHKDCTVGKLDLRVCLALRERDTQKIQSHKIDKSGVVIDFTRELASRFL